MNILSIDTTTKKLGLGLSTDNGCITLCMDIGYKHAETILIWIEKIINQMNIAIQDLDLVVCAIGPGSFTGLRIGLATAKGIAIGIGCPFVGIPSLDIYAYIFRNYNGVVIPVIDARKKRYYAAFYLKGKIITEYLDIDPSKLYMMFESYDRILLTGPDAPSLMQKNKTTFSIDTCLVEVAPQILIKIGKKKYKTSGASFDELSPLYIRKSEAEVL